MMNRSKKVFVYTFCFYIILTLPAYAEHSAAEEASSIPPGCSAPHFSSLDGARYGFPPSIEKGGLTFAGVKIPIERPDVRKRILKQVNYLLQDRRSKLLHWLLKADTHSRVILPILKEYDLPEEYIYLAAIESSFNSRALSSAGAYGFWQFIKSTAVCGPHGCDQYDWKMNINKWKDERANLSISTHAAARYLCWLNRVKKVDLENSPPRNGFQDWLLTSAAYNAGPQRVTKQMIAFKTTSYWDTPLPIETEKYVPRWMAVWLIHKYRDFYGIRIPKQQHIKFDTVLNVKLQKDLSFTTMAKLLSSTPREVWAINTEVAPEKGVFPGKKGRSGIHHTINVPHGMKSKFLAQLAKHGYIKNK